MKAALFAFHSNELLDTAIEEKISTQIIVLVLDQRRLGGGDFASSTEMK